MEYSRKVGELMSVSYVIGICAICVIVAVSFTYLMCTARGNKLLKKKEAAHKKEIEDIQQERVNFENQSRAQQKYLMNMIHDVRTPINAINGMTELITRENNNDSVNEYANSIKRAGNVLNQLVNDMLDMSKLESGNMELVEDTYDIVEVLNDVVSLTKDKCNKKGLTFDVRVDENIPCSLLGDENRLRQVLMNLLSNAVKYTASGKVILEAKACDGIKNGKVDIYFSVEDTGCGIKEEDAGKIFQSFKRVDSLKNNMIEGTGLGLNIVYSLLELMGTKIQVKSKYGVGSRFYFTLTQKVVDEASIGNFISLYNKQLDKKSNYKVSFVAPDAKILVVDDNEMNLLLTSRLLQKTEMEIETAKSAMKCLELINQKKYNLILMDVKMPEIDGVEALKRIRGGNSINKQIPIIALTADTEKGVREKYLDAGFSDYVSKPFNPIKLEKKVKKFIPNHLLKSVHNPNGVEKKVFLLNVNEGLKYCSDDMDMYNEVLATYFKLGMENILNMNKQFQQGEWENYNIQVHSLKSTSQTIGAKSLYEMAKKLEEASKKEDTTYIVLNHDEMITTYKKVLAEIEEYFYKMN